MVQAQAALEIVVFELGRQRFALAVTDVERVLRAVASSPLPRAPAVIEGVISLAGDPVAVVDLRARFGLPARPVEASDMLLVTHAGDRRVAVRADRVRGVVRTDPAQVRDAATVAPMAGQIAGVVTLADGVVLLQDPKAFLTAAEADQLDDLIETAS